MAKTTLAQLKARFKTTESSGGPNNYYPFYDMDVGDQAIVRFLPDKNEDNPLGFLVEKLSHTLTINGEKKNVPCLKMYGEDCPICKVSAAFYKDDDKENGKKYWRKKQHIGQVLVIEDPLPANKETQETHEGKTRFINLGNQIHEIITDAFEGDLEDIPYLYETGTNFIIKKKQTSEWASYSTSKFAKSATALDDETIAHVESSLIDLSTLLPKHPGREKIEDMLEAALSGTEYVDTSKTSSKKPSSVEDEEEEVVEKSTKVAPKKAVKEETKEDEPDDVDEDAEEILRRIRERRSTKE